MLARSSLPASAGADARAAVVIEMIGDVDATAARAFAEAGARLLPDGGERIVLNLRRGDVVEMNGMVALKRAIDDLRWRGTDVDVVADAKTTRTALRSVRVLTRHPLPSDGEARERHLMIVRNAKPKRDIA